MTNLHAEPALDQPYYGAPFGAAVRRIFKKYATFTGRASRSEYWWWILANGLVVLVLNVLALVTGGVSTGPYGEIQLAGGIGVIFVVLSVIWGLATIIPHIAVLVRRLHDTNRSGFWAFIYFVPFVGPIILLVFTLLDSKPEGARFDR
ncbi:predicted membrane protein [Microbacterium testaceum StLB037]|uniref:Predicted membrane protein n=1 Tax=Microbacterium testaceum (strain StLB037) TaxID=979556 RepID=E8N9H3_MICTS|nr:DUF805 domain-containing protein [Microbacterium testaceum]BAJ73220.1 predicted membrane protein [Microbacterium testaceum StLB037]